MMTFITRSLFALLFIASSTFAVPPSDPDSIRLLAELRKASIEQEAPTEKSSITTETPVTKEIAATNKERTDVIMKTSMGSLVIALFPEKAPITVANFLSYVDDGFYDNTVFHRVIPGFVIQGGGFDKSMRKKQTKAPIINESDNGVVNRRGTLSMARTPNPDSATTQFFINLENNASLDANFNKPGYAVFGEVIEGLPIVDMVSRVKTGNVQQHRDVPVEPVLILSAQRKASK